MVFSVEKRNVFSPNVVLSVLVSLSLLHPHNLCMVVHHTKLPNALFCSQFKLLPLSRSVSSNASSDLFIVCVTLITRHQDENETANFLKYCIIRNGRMSRRSKNEADSLWCVVVFFFAIDNGHTFVLVSAKAP